MSRPARGTFRQTISIHALREEGDLADLPDEQREYIISIHALREEGDDLSREVFVDELDFYPRPPRGGRLCFVDFCSRSVRFLSTPSARRATVVTSAGSSLEPIFLSTPSARRATRPVCLPKFYPFYFYPRPPRGGRPELILQTRAPGQFLSTPSARRATKQQSDR